MKILLRVLGTLFATVALIVCFGGVIRNFRDAADTAYIEAELENGKAQMEELQQSMKELGGSTAEMDKSVAQMEDAADAIPTKSVFTTAGILAAALGIFSILLIVFQYVTNRKLVLTLLLLTLVTGVLFVVLSPELEETFTSGISNRKLAIIATVPAILAAITAFMATRMTLAERIARS